MKAIKKFFFFFHFFELLVGSSIFENIRVNDMKENTAIRIFPGATI